MPEESPLIQSLRTAVAAAPNDVPLRVHLAEVLPDAGYHDAAITEAAVALQHAPANPQVRNLATRTMGAPDSRTVDGWRGPVATAARLPSR